MRRSAHDVPAAINAMALKSVVVSISGYALDGFDFLIFGFMVPAIALGLGLSLFAVTSLVSATLAGTVLGGTLFGLLSDRYGRVRVLSWTILLFAGATGLCSVAQGYWDLLAYRVIAGFGLGGEFGIGMTLVAEIWPPAFRARASSYVALGWQAGALSAALATPLLLSAWGWRCFRSRPSAWSRSFFHTTSIERT